MPCTSDRARGVVCSSWRACGAGRASITSSNPRSEEHTSELQSPCNLVCRLLLEKKNRSKLDRLEIMWDYGYSMPIAVRYTQEAFSSCGWLWPVDAKGEQLKPMSNFGVGFYGDR